jgi:acyl-ACP thioesterase
MTKKMIDEYSRSLRVPVYDVGPSDKLQFGAALRLVQETSEQHLGVLHVGYEDMLKASGFVFFIISTRAEIIRMPAHNEMITIKTHPCGRGGAQFYRDFKFYDGDGRLIIDAMQTTVVADAKTRKVQRPQVLKPFGIYPENIIKPEERMSRFNVPEDLPFAGERDVFYSDLDANGHMNNSVYGDVVTDFIPDEMRGKACTVQINYLGETGRGDTLKVNAGFKDGKYLMRGENRKGLSFTAAVL